MSDRQTLRRWITEGIDERAIQTLSRELPASELWSLLLWLTEQRALSRTTNTLQQQWERDRFVQPSLVDQRHLLEIDSELLHAADGFESIELSPLAPLGTCSRVALTSQNRVVSTVRGTEVVSDPTNVLALESASRLRKRPAQIVKLATSHRCVRSQPHPDKPGFAAHFRMFCMTTAGHESADQQFTLDALIEHIRIQWHGLARLEQRGYAFPMRTVTLLASAERAHLADRIETGLGEMHIERKPLDHGYYNGLRFMIQARSSQGEDIPLVDGGAFDWVGKLASNDKLAFVASAIGTQLAAFAFRA